MPDSQLPAHRVQQPRSDYTGILGEPNEGRTGRVPTSGLGASGHVKTSKCSRDDARERLEQGQADLVTAEVIGDERNLAGLTGPWRSTLTQNAVHACIAAADAICCARLGLRSNDRNHKQAAQLLEQARVGQQLTNRFAAVLDIKGKAEYQSIHPSVSEAKMALRVARQLLTLARTIV